MQAAAARDTIGVYMNSDQITKSCRAFLQLRRARNQTSDSQLAYDAGFCLGAVYSVMDMNAFHSEQLLHSVHFPKFCMPDSVNGNDAAEAVGLFIDMHPELRTLGGYALIRRALAATWSC
jgi:hypothetical protein